MQVSMLVLSLVLTPLTLDLGLPIRVSLLLFQSTEWDEIEPTIDESEFESDASNLNDEDMGNSMKDSTSGGGAGDHGEELVHHDLIDDIQQENHTAQLSSSSSLQSLRYHALRHDCPHCKCCVGNLLEV
ncbi:unnamed protein product [Trichobilharzia regenti]|nr:unnamed protein product [Trichobilharzia regenti]